MIFIINILVSGCYTLQSTTKKIGTERIPRTEQETGVKKYITESQKYPSDKNPITEVELLESIQYKVETHTKYQKAIYKRSGFTKAWRFIGLPIGAITFSAIYYPTRHYVSNPGWRTGGYYYNDETGTPIAIIAGTICLTTWWASVFGRNTKLKYQYKSSEPQYYFKSFPIAEAKVLIKNENVSKSFVTNINGQLQFNPITDFSLDYAKSNDLKEFRFFYKNQEFDKPLELPPALWLNKYAKIIKPSVNISEHRIDNYPLVGVARKGLEYKIIDEDNQLNKYKIELFESKYGWLNSFDVETFYSSKVNSDISVAIKNYVEDKMSTWQMQGEFEGTEDYSKRMGGREDKLKDLTFEAMDLFQNDYISMISWDDATISRYDPNSQTFKIEIPEINNFVLHVPIEIAQVFKNNWHSRDFINQKFILVDGSWELLSLEIKVPEVIQPIEYNSNLTFSYNPVNQFSFNLEPLKIYLPEENEFDDLASIKYDISINLPKTEMSNPDAVAVVIGNANYKYASNVDYAINDAQLVKTYLVNVLGYNPGNVLFCKNASKAEFEGIFGTKENFKGKLYNYIKENISDVIVFYSGHGAPGLNDQKGYFVPVDCDPSYVELQGYNSDILYENLSKISAKSVTVINDACFSGVDVIDNISSIIPEVHQPIFKINNGSLLSSSSMNEVASWLKQQQHGLFTYFFLKAIHDYQNSDNNNDGQLTLNEIFNYVSDNSNGVPYYARRLNAKEQHPTLIGDKEKILIEY